MIARIAIKTIICKIKYPVQGISTSRQIFMFTNKFSIEVLLIGCWSRIASAILRQTQVKITPAVFESLNYLFIIIYKKKSLKVKNNYKKIKKQSLFDCLFIYYIISMVNLTKQLYSIYPYRAKDNTPINLINPDAYKQVTPVIGSKRIVIKNLKFFNELFLGIKTNPSRFITKEYAINIFLVKPKVSNLPVVLLRGVVDFFL